jgi:DNA-binding NarL/FixJ family response regulator
VIRVLLADDQQLVRSGFRMILHAQPEIEVVGEAGDGDEAVSLARELKPDVVLMDVRMPKLDGIAATRRLLEEPEPPRVLVLTTFDLDEYVFAALRAGATGFLLKDAPEEQLFAAIRVAADGGALFAPSVTRRLIERFTQLDDPVAPVEMSDLTRREVDVLTLLARGLSNAEIAGELVVSEHTVKSHVARVLQKLGLRDRTQAVIAAYESGLVRPGAPGVTRRSMFST